MELLRKVTNMESKKKFVLCAVVLSVIAVAIAFLLNEFVKEDDVEEEDDNDYFDDYDDDDMIVEDLDLDLD